MKREEILNMSEYNISLFQLQVRQTIINYMDDHEYTEKEMRHFLNVSKRKFKKILDADYDFEYSELIIIHTKMGKKITISYEPLQNYKRSVSTSTSQTVIKI